MLLLLLYQGGNFVPYSISWAHACSYLEKLTFTKRKTAPPKAGRGGLHLGHQNWEVKAGGSWITSQLRLYVSDTGITLLHLNKYICTAHFRIIILESSIIYAFAIFISCLFLYFLHKEFPNILQLYKLNKRWFLFAHVILIIFEWVSVSLVKEATHSSMTSCY